MDRKTLMPLLLAVGAALLYFIALNSKASSVSRAYAMTKVIVASQDLPPRTIIRPGLISTADIPRKFMAQDAFEVKSPSDIKLIENLVTQVRIPKGNQITQSALISLSAEAGLAVKVPLGYRGAVLPVDQDLLKLMKPGDRVDILVTFEALMADGHKEKVTATILQNILVLGVGTNLGQGRSAQQEKAVAAAEAAAAQFQERGSLSVALNPNETQYLALAMKQGEVAVVVRGLGDIAMHPIEMASFRKLFK